MKYLVYWLLGKAAWGVGILIVLSLVTFAGDWAVWKARGSVVGQVQRTDMDVVHLKGNKLEYDYNGKYLADCSRTLFPQAGEGACWWLEKHKANIHEY